ncbi:venom allergen 3-like [Prorops nasuta]|uniref:venom allergen 3-like n=1 Tax=Prorops nasuta TaxID=863751 RepID=UPI0034CF9A5E
MCKYKRKSVSETCRKYKLRKIGLKTKEQRSILNKHNELRALIATGKYPGQPGARNLGPLKWSPEAARIAQTWANQCNFNHDGCRTLKNNVPVGQNLGYFSKFNVDKIIQMWFDEVKDFNPRLINSYRAVGGAVTSHYTQLVWADTTHVGCGLTSYDKPYNKDPSKLITIHYLVCNYFPRGNILGRRVYKISH